MSWTAFERHFPERPRSIGVGGMEVQDANGEKKIRVVWCQSHRPLPIRFRRIGLGQQECRCSRIRRVRGEPSLRFWQQRTKITRRNNLLQAWLNAVAEQSRFLWG